MNDMQRRYMHARNNFEVKYVNPAKELLEATAALVAAANARVAETQEVIDELRPVWAQGFTSDSEAAQANGNALAELWKLLRVDNQTAAVERLTNLMEPLP